MHLDDRGAGGHKVYHRKLWHDITARLKRDIWRRSAIEPMIWHIKKLAQTNETEQIIVSPPLMPEDRIFQGGLFNGRD